MSKIILQITSQENYKRAAGEAFGDTQTEVKKELNFDEKIQRAIVDPVIAAEPITKKTLEQIQQHELQVIRARQGAINQFIITHIQDPEIVFANLFSALVSKEYFEEAKMLSAPIDGDVETSEKFAIQNFGIMQKYVDKCTFEKLSDQIQKALKEGGKSRKFEDIKKKDIKSIKFAINQIIQVFEESSAGEAQLKHTVDFKRRLFGTNEEYQALVPELFVRQVSRIYAQSKRVPKFDNFTDGASGSKALMLAICNLDKSKEYGMVLDNQMDRLFDMANSNGEELIKLGLPSEISAKLLNLFVSLEKIDKIRKEYVEYPHLQSKIETKLADLEIFRSNASMLRQEAENAQKIAGAKNTDAYQNLVKVDQTQTEIAQLREKQAKPLRYVNRNKDFDTICTHQITDNQTQETSSQLHALRVVTEIGAAHLRSLNTIVAPADEVVFEEWMAQEEIKEANRVQQLEKRNYEIDELFVTIDLKIANYRQRDCSDALKFIYSVIDKKNIILKDVVKKLIGNFEFYSSLEKKEVLSRLITVLTQKESQLYFKSHQKQPEIGIENQDPESKEIFKTIEQYNIPDSIFISKKFRSMFESFLFTNSDTVIQYKIVNLLGVIREFENTGKDINVTSLKYYIDNNSTNSAVNKKSFTILNSETYKINGKGGHAKFILSLSMGQRLYINDNNGQLELYMYGDNFEGSH